MTEINLPKGYEPQDVEERWMHFWKDEQTFTPDVNEDAPPYCIVIPPPNVTGTLHMGHALNLTLQDILCRAHRQLGYNVLWVPGTDHAGIATQNVVERFLAKEGQTRQELGREKFVERVWEWKEEYGGKILNQLNHMGASVDWSRLRFTMDEGLSRAVREVFVRLYEQGLIYQGNYIINWCPRCHTALADLEVDYAEKEGGLYHLRYPLADGSAEVVIATTRPETMLGDTAVAVHPEDERYKHLIGKEIILPLLKRRIPVIADSYVDKEFGTGCLKITPAHDPNDFDLGQRHNLPSVQVIDANAQMTEEAGAEYKGLDRFSCRKKVLEDLDAAGFLIKKESYQHNVGHCYRCKTVVEPYVSKQWFVAVAPLAKKARDAVTEGQTKILPEQWNKTYFEWLDNIRDWCISRQIWWGHRIPAWTCEDCGELIVSREDPEACPKCSSEHLHQDEDVLDTWFSSALWPFSTLGWPDETPELRVFYPTSVLVTAFDILFFWVARMMMMGVHFMQEVPFRHVYIHAIVRDEQGQKMSKSTGNVIDPLDMISKYGTDSLRFTLTAFAAMGRDIKLSEKRIEGYRHFINKIWNAARFALMNLPDQLREKDLSKLEKLDHIWILHRLERIKAEVKDAVQEYRFNDMAQTLYEFFWHEFCDWYLEMIKPDLYGEDREAAESAQYCLHTVLSEILILLHPVIPFVTQEIWQYLPSLREKNLAKQAFPQMRDNCLNSDIEHKMQLLQEVVVSVRNIRSELNINPAQKLDLLMRVHGEKARFLNENRDTIIYLARLGSLNLAKDIQAPKASATAVVQGHELFVPLEGAINFEDELNRLDKELKKLNKELEGLNKKLSNDNFINKAPAEVVAKEKAKEEELAEKKNKLENLQARLGEIKKESTDKN
jgi:valyl-tRNA synthetase